LTRPSNFVPRDGKLNGPAQPAFARWSVTKETHVLIAQHARAMLDGKLSFIEGARKIAGARFAAGLDHDPDILVFAAIESDTDALPIGQVRESWQAEALAKAQPEIERAEKWAREMGARNGRSSL
jgi:hypothetical protein